jgi:hypothetical protein
MLMGGLAKGAGAGGAGLSPQMPDFGAGARAMPGGGLLDMLTPMLDSNRDGSALDDVLRMASGFLNRR